MATLQESVQKSSADLIKFHYTFLYRYMHTIVTKRKSSANTNDAIKLCYNYNHTGKSVSAYEIKSGTSCSSSYISSDEDYVVYGSVVSEKPVLEALFNSNHEKQLSATNSTTSATSNVMSSLAANIDGEEYIFSMAFVGDVGADKEINNRYAKAELRQGSSTIASLEFDCTCKDQQLKVAHFSTNTVLNNLTVKVTLSNNSGTCAFGYGQINKHIKKISSDCVSKKCSTSQTAYFSESSPARSWYTLVHPTNITYGSANTPITDIKMTARDYIATKESMSRNSSSYNLWYNNRKGLVASATNAKVKYDSMTAYAIGSLYFGRVTKQQGKTNVFEQSYSTGSQYIISADRAYLGTTRYEAYTHINDKHLVSKTKDHKGVAVTYAYDAYGNVTNQYTCNVSDVSFGITNDFTYSNSGAFLQSETSYIWQDSRTTTYANEAATGNLTSITSPRNQSTNYTYKTNKVQLAKIASTVGSENSNQFNYSSGLISSLTHNSLSYNLTYDSYNDISTVKIGTTTILTKNYTYSPTLDTSETIYGNAQKVKKIYNKYGILIKVQEYVGTAYLDKVIYIYCDDGVDCTNITNPEDPALKISSVSKLRKLIDNYSAITYNYAYDALGNITEVKKGSTDYITNAYDNKNRQTKCTVAASQGNSVTDYTYSNDDPRNQNKLQESKTTYGSLSWTSSETTDSLDRLQSSQTKLGNNALVNSFNYCYVEDAEGQTDGATQLLSGVSYYTKIGSNPSVNVGSDTYNYDADYNISSVSNKTGNVYNSTSYLYDNLNRLTRENNQKLNKTYTYTYNAGGNITSKKEYAYTTGTLGTPTATYNYTYPTSGWKDRLSAWNGYTFAYDNAGNPTTYKGNTLTWTRGRLLATYGSYSNTYNADGIRTHKSWTIGNVGHWSGYTVEGTRLLQEERGTGSTSLVYRHYLNFIYTHQGLVGFTYDNTPYYYLKNVLGDIIAIYNASNVLVGSYTYDAWGNCTIGTNTNDIANINPFRYRGYYWDSDLQLYYLQTRYYDPQIGRFINADDISYLEPETINGLNLYAYCSNNPVMYTDSTGTSPWHDTWWGKALIGVGIVVGTALFVAAIVASAGTVGALAGVGAAALGFSATTVSTIATVATMGTYVVAAGVGLFGLSDAVEVSSGGVNPIRDWVMGGNQTAYNVTRSVFDVLGSVAVIAGTFGSKILQQVAKGGTPKISNGKTVGYQRSFTDKSGKWNFRIDATNHGNPGAAPWHHNPHIHFLDQGGKGKAVYYFWEVIRRLFDL